jgi:hypothetical protein
LGSIVDARPCNPSTSAPASALVTPVSSTISLPTYLHERKLTRQ